MYNIDEFAEEVKKLLKLAMMDKEILIHSVTKNNGQKYKGIMIKNDTNVTPVIYLEQFYDVYCAGAVTMSEIIERIINLNETAVPIDHVFPDYDKILNPDYIKDNVYPILVNAKANKSLLKQVYNEPLLDLTIIYVICNEKASDYLASCKVTYEMLEKANISKEYLHEKAFENLNKLEYTLMNFKDFFEKTFGIIQPELEFVPMYFFKTNMNAHGSNVLLNEKAMKDAADQIGNFYIIPSSIHECLLIPDSEDIDKQTIVDAIFFVNNDKSSIPPEEVLSGSLYYYSKDKGLMISEEHDII